MTAILMVLLFVVMAGVVYVLVRGVIAMASGKDMTGEQSQMWMRRRVLFQAVAIVIVILILVIAGSANR
ncbi:MAG TPA: HIG1 domain-containing protein [Sphingomicrobium sp.]|nr:HIG1 domain-containing protein [Sphingomicrobium sp.]